jgi:hypothetical protein
MAANSSCFEEVRRRDTDAVKQYILFAADRRLGSMWATDIVPNPEDPRMVMVRFGGDIIAIFDATEITWELWCRPEGSGP